MFIVMGDIVKKDSGRALISAEEVEEKIVVIRKMEVIADADVAELYGVETRRVNEAVKTIVTSFLQITCSS